MFQEWIYSKQLIRTIIFNAVALALTFSLFFMFFSSQNTKQDKLLKEIEGIGYVVSIDNIKISLQKIRGLSQILIGTNDSAIKNSMQLKIKALKEDVTSQLKQMKASMPITENKWVDATLHEIFNDVHQLLEQDLTDKDTLFNRYSNSIQRIKTFYTDIGDRYQLFFDSDRESYFLIIMTLYEIPQIQEYMAKIRGLGAQMIAMNNFSNAAIFELTFNYKRFEEHIYSAEHYIKRLNTHNTAYHELNRIFLKLNEISIDKRTAIEYIFEHRHANMDSVTYFNTASNIISITDELLFKTISHLKIQLYDRYKMLQKEINYSIIILILIILGIASNFVMSIGRIYKEHHAQKLDEAVTEFKDLLTKAQSLKETCDISLSTVCHYYQLYKGVFYLYNKQNNKLSLGATFGINEESIKTLIPIGNGDIGQVAKEQRPLERITKENASSMHVITKPLTTDAKLIGVIQIVSERHSLHLKNINSFCDIMAAYVYDKILINSSEEMIQLVDENIITSQTNINGMITYVSKAFVKITGYTKEELIGKNHNIIRHPDTPTEVFKDLWHTIKNGAVWNGELKNLRKDGSYYWVEATISPNFDLYGNVIGYTAIRQDITDQKHIEELSIRDSMTGLYNRRKFESGFESIKKRAKDTNKILAFAIMDVDHFKQYNDTYGHQMGDEALKAVASVLKQNMHLPEQYAYRLGGEEFGMLYMCDSKESAVSIAQNARAGVEALKIEHAKNSASPYITISAGLFMLDLDKESDIDEIYKLADASLYEAKENGRNQVVQYLS